MTVQLSKAQIEAIKVELAQYGLNVSVARQSRKASTGCNIEQQIARVRAMTFKTANVKSRILRTLKTAIAVREARKAPNIGALLALFGVRLQAVTPWPDAIGFDQRWQALRNGMLLALPAPVTPCGEPKHYGMAATHKRIET